MLSVDEALSAVLDSVAPLTASRVAVADAADRVLAEDIISDIDSPPYDKSTVDGYALRAADVAAGERALAVIEEVTAGGWPRLTVGPRQATRIMTGAPLPSGADAVVMVEHTAAGEWTSDPIVQLSDRPVAAGQNIFRRAQSLAQGQIVLRAGHVVRPIEQGLLSEVGRTAVVVIPRPRVAILATGDELVEPHLFPALGQIRNSNGPMLLGMAARAGAVGVDLGIARDNQQDLSERIERGLAHDVLVLSGGVSVGMLDLVPRTLVAAGVEQRFHQVHLRPGKPLWFGTRNVASHRTLVFGLPGNPVSSLVCWELFVKPALLRLQGHSLATTAAHDSGSTTHATLPMSLNAPLLAAHTTRGDRPTFWPAVLESSAIDPAHVRLLNWQGSADLRTLVDANCLVHFPPGERRYEKGESVTVRML